jgi:kelch-like protein 36
MSIFAFGGKNRDGALSSVEKYDIVNNEWTFVQPLPSSYYAHSGAYLNNTVYLSGGYAHGHFTPDLLSFSMLTNQWNELRPMNAARGWHSMCVVNENLYVFGGCYLANSIKNFMYNLSLILYLIENKNVF